MSKYNYQDSSKREEDPKVCGDCYHFNLNAVCFSFCLIQEKDVYEGDTCDMYTKNERIGIEREKKITKWIGTVFEGGSVNFDK